MDDCALVEDFIEVTLPTEQDFLKVKETLTRIGVASHKNRKLFQSCHILHKRGRYFIVHFKELFMLDGLESNFDEEDKGRRNTISNLLRDWGLVVLVDNNKSSEPIVHISKIKIIKHHERDDWELCPKYHIGKTK